MRTTDREPGFQRPLGEKVQRPVSAPPARGDTPVPGAASGIVRGPDGRLRTTTHKEP